MDCATHPDPASVNCRSVYGSGDSERESYREGQSRLLMFAGARLVVWKNAVCGFDGRALGSGVRRAKNREVPPGDLRLWRPLSGGVSSGSRDGRLRIMFAAIPA